MQRELKLSVGQAAEILGVSDSTLRKWESIGLIKPADRRILGWRVYTSKDIQDIQKILNERRLNRIAGAEGETDGKS